MIPIRTLEKTTTSILYELPPGKPDSSKPVEGDVDNRPRVVQKAQKSDTCWYYAINRIRSRIGAGNKDQFPNERANEQIFSAWRKGLTSIFDNLPPLIQNFDSEEKQQLFASIDQEKAKQLIINKEPKYFYKTKGKSCPAELLQQFIQENCHQNFLDFLLNRISVNLHKVDMELFNKLGLTNIVNAINKEKDLCCSSRMAIHLIPISLLANYNNLLKTKWSPLHDIDYLIQELTLNGPFAVLGKFGNIVYQKQASKSKVDGKYYWPEGTKRIENGDHAVVIVGAKKANDSALVYFIDPMDISDPNDPTSQKTYKISYKNLTSHIVTNECEKTIKKANDCYGYHGHFKL